MCHRVTSREASTTLVSPPRRSPEPAVGGRVIKFMATIHVPHLVQIYEYPLPDATEELPRLPTAHSSADFHSGRKGVARAQCWWMEEPRVWSGEGEGEAGAVQEGGEDVERCGAGREVCVYSVQERSMAPVVGLYHRHPHPGLAVPPPPSPPSPSSPPSSPPPGALHHLCLPPRITVPGLWLGAALSFLLYFSMSAGSHKNAKFVTRTLGKLQHVKHRMRKICAQI